MDRGLRGQTRMSINEPGRGIFAGGSDVAATPVVVADVVDEAAWVAGCAEVCPIAAAKNALAAASFAASCGWAAWGA